MFLRRLPVGLVMWCFFFLGCWLFLLFFCCFIPFLFLSLLSNVLCRCMFVLCTYLQSFACLSLSFPSPPSFVVVATHNFYIYIDSRPFLFLVAAVCACLCILLFYSSLFFSIPSHLMSNIKYPLPQFLPLFSFYFFLSFLCFAVLAACFSPPPSSFLHKN